MTLKQRSQRWIAFAICMAVVLAVSVYAPLATQATAERTRDALERNRHKMPELLQEYVVYARNNPQRDESVPLIVRVRKEFFDQETSGPNALRSIHSYATRMTGSQIAHLIESDLVEFVTIDVPVRAFAKGGNGKGKGKGKKQDSGTTDNGTTDSEADTATNNSTDNSPIHPTDPITDGQARLETILSTLGVDQLSPTIDGSGVTVALFDSGAYKHHDVKERLLARVDFTSGQAVFPRNELGQLSYNDDEFGHGTHVAGIIGGDGTRSRNGFSGIAPEVDFVDLKVVNAEGWGVTSHLVAAIDWVIDHQSQYNIRVANLSLGAPTLQSYLDDPLCQAAERLVAAGIITVASAGNVGKTDRHSKIWGGITSPGIDPLVITVGAVNTHGTVTHTDDTATSYSSRGPTYKDRLFKPDLSAPGNRVPSLLADDSFIAFNYPEYVLDRYYVDLSGSSMAAAVVSGTVALMLNAKEKLNPNIAKLILLVSATKLTQPHMLEQGNGLVNVKAAVEMAQNTNMRKEKIGGTTPYWTLPNGEQVWVGGAFAYGDQIIYSPLVDPDREAFWGSGVFWSDAITGSSSDWAEDIFYDNGVFWADGVFWTDRSVRVDNRAWTQGVFWSDGVFWADGVFWSDRIFWADGVFWSDGIFWSDLRPTFLFEGDPQ